MCLLKGNLFEYPKEYFYSCGLSFGGLPRFLCDLFISFDISSFSFFDSTDLSIQSLTSSLRQRRRLLPGRRHLGGRHFGFRVASLRILFTVFFNAKAKEGANKRGNSSRLTQSFHFFMFEPIFSPVNALNQPI